MSMRGNVSIISSSVSLAGAPAIDRNTMDDLVISIPPLIVAESSEFATSVGTLFDLGILEMVIVPRFGKPTTKQEEDFKPTQGWFDQSFRVLMADTALSGQSY